MFTSSLIKTQHVLIIWKIEAVFQFFSSFYHSIFVALFCYLVEKPIHAFSEQLKYHLILAIFDMLVEKNKRNNVPEVE